MSDGRQISNVPLGPSERRAVDQAVGLLSLLLRTPRVYTFIPEFFKLKSLKSQGAITFCQKIFSS